MADQDPKTGAVDPRPEEMDTGTKTGQAAPSAPKTDAAGKDTAAVSGSGNSQETPTPPAPSATDTQSSGGEASAKTDPVKSFLDAGYANDVDGGKAAIIVAGTSVQSVANTTAMVAKAETQSTDMQTGAQVAHDNAFGSLVKRLETLCEKLGKEAAEKVATELAKFHGIEDTVKKALKQAGVID